MYNFFGLTIRNELEEKEFLALLDSRIKHASFLQSELDKFIDYFNAQTSNLKAAHQNEATELKRRLTSLTAQVQVLSKSREQTTAEAYWNDKKPQAKIKYKGRILPTDKTSYSIDVRNFIQPYDHDITDDLNSQNLMVINSSFCEDKIRAIYEHHQTKWLLYDSDQNVLGVPEYWSFPSEMRELILSGKGQDCDDASNNLASYLVAAGVPYWRIRVACGVTNSGIGHATVYALADDLMTWRHLNSTAPASLIPGVFSKLPKSGDSQDAMGIKDYWFSYNQKLAFHVFESQAAEESFEEFKKKFEVIQ